MEKRQEEAKGGEESEEGVTYNSGWNPVSFVSAYLYSALQIETQSLLLKFSFTGVIALGMVLISLGIILIQRAK